MTVSRIHKLLVPHLQYSLRLNHTKTSTKKHFPRKIFSGIQPTGSMHLGNYLGAITQWVDLQNNGENVTFSIVDMHSLTLPQDPQKISKSILEMTATLLACGIDPNKSTIFQQSRVVQHPELFWYLSCICTMARLAHIPQYKEKSPLVKDVPLGLYIYPVLQAADILVHKATHVPVGEDQVQNIQLCQELAQMFNKRYGTTFPIPHSLISEKGDARIRSLRDPSKKMSKSDPDPKSRICLMDSDDEILKKIKKAVTDFISAVTYEPEKRPGVSNLVLIHSLLSGESTENICKEAEDLDTGKYKYIVADAVIAYIKPIREKINDLITNPDYLDNILQQGAERAAITAEQTVIEVKQKLGLNIKDNVQLKAQMIV